MAKLEHTPQYLRKKILARRDDYLPVSNGHNIPLLVPTMPSGIHAPPKNPTKTSMMVLLERQHGRPIEELIWLDSITNVASSLGVSKFTVSLWRKKFPLNGYNTGPNNRKLPIDSQ